MSPRAQTGCGEDGLHNPDMSSMRDTANTIVLVSDTI